MTKTTTVKSATCASANGKEMPLKAADEHYLAKAMTSKFLVLIRQPERWKVESIARLKMVRKEREIRKKEEEARFLAKKMITPAKGAKKGGTASNKGSGASASARSEAEEERRKRASMEQFKRELETLHNNSTIIQNKLQAMNSLRASLLWLLKKSTSLERTVIS